MAPTDVQTKTTHARLELSAALRQLRQREPTRVREKVQILLSGALGSVERALKVLRK